MKNIYEVEAGLMKQFLVSRSWADDTNLACVAKA